MNRSTILLIALLVVLGAIVIFVLPSSKEHEFSDKTPDINVAVDSASVIKLDMVRPGMSLTIENVGGKWMITSPGHYQADASSVIQLLHGLSKFKIGSIISSNPEKQSLFQVDNSGTQITTTERTGKTTSLIIGKMGPSFSEVYFRLLGSKDVYLAEGIDTWSVTKEIKEWRDKTILTIPTESVKRLTYTTGARQYEFRKDSAGWKSGDAVVESNIMNSPLTSLNNLRADDFVDSSVKFQNAPVTVAVQGIDNVQLNLYPASSDSAKFFLQLSSSPQIFVVSKSTAQQILQPIESHQGQSKTSSFASNIKKEVQTSPPQAAEEKKPVKESPPAVTSMKKEPEKTTNAPDFSSAKKFPVKKAASKNSNKEVEKQPQPSVVTAKKETAPSQRPDLSSAKKFPIKKARVNKVGITNEPKNEAPLSNIISDNTPAPVTKKTETAPSQSPVKQSSSPPAKASTSGPDDDGDLTVVTVKSGDTMQSLAKKYSVTVEQILKWNLLKSISVKPGQELYIYVKK